MGDPNCTDVRNIRLYIEDRRQVWLGLADVAVLTATLRALAVSALESTLAEPVHLLHERRRPSQLQHQAAILPKGQRLRFDRLHPDHRGAGLPLHQGQGVL